MPLNDEILLAHRIQGLSNMSYNGDKLDKYRMDRGQGRREDIPLWIQLSLVIVNVLRDLDCGLKTVDPMTGSIIHTVDMRIKLDFNILRFSNIQDS